LKTRQSITVPDTPRMADSRHTSSLVLLGIIHVERSKCGIDDMSNVSGDIIMSPDTCSRVLTSRTVLIEMIELDISSSINNSTPLLVSKTRHSITVPDTPRMADSRHTSSLVLLGIIHVERSKCGIDDMSNVCDFSII
jgi:hypothetical protein